MFEEHDVFQPPADPDIYIWRYIDLPKYISLLNDKTLYFCRMDKLIDRFEGSLPRPNILLRKADPHSKSIVQSSDGRLETAEKSWERRIRIERAHAFVNCWHMNEHESAAMWQLYCSNTQGIAIRSTYQALCESFRNYPCAVYVGVVNYMDYDQELIRDPRSNTPQLFNMLYPLMHKRRSYQHEAELRALVTWTKLAKIVFTPVRNEGGARRCTEIRDTVHTLCYTSPAWIACTGEPCGCRLTTSRNCNSSLLTISSGATK